MTSLPSRQVHLDFHTSEHIPEVGAGFSKTQFQDALKLGRVNSINIFAKCHHGWSYYPTKVGQRAPDAASATCWASRSRPATRSACARPIYYTVGWSATDAELHPEWVVRGTDGSPAARNFDPAAKPDDPKPPVSWKFLCPSGGYRELILAQTARDLRALPGGRVLVRHQLPARVLLRACRPGMAAAGSTPRRRRAAAGV